MYRVEIGLRGSRGGRGCDLSSCPVCAGRYRAKKSSDYLREGAVRMQIGCVCPWTGAGAGLRKGKGFNTSESQRLEKMRAPRRSGPHRGVERKGNGDGARYKKFDAEVAVQSSERKADLEPNVARPIAASTQTREILRLTENDGLTATPTAKQHQRPHQPCSVTLAPTAKSRRDADATNSTATSPIIKLGEVSSPALIGGGFGLRRRRQAAALPE